MIGVLLGLSAAFGFGTAAVFARLGLQHIKPTTGTLISLIVGATITMALAVIFHAEAIRNLSGLAFVWFLFSGVVNFPLGRLLNFTGVSLVGVSKSAPIVGSSPLFATMLAITFGGESINTLIALGTMSIILGLALILSQK